MALFRRHDQGGPRRRVRQLGFDQAERTLRIAGVVGLDVKPQIAAGVGEYRAVLIELGLAAHPLRQRVAEFPRPGRPQLEADAQQHDSLEFFAGAIRIELLRQMLPGPVAGQVVLAQDKRAVNREIRKISQAPLAEGNVELLHDRLQDSRLL